MLHYQVILSENAETDFEEYIDYIISECSAPLTALRHYENFYYTLKSLENMPCSLPIQNGLYFLRFGSNVRRLNFKKMAIIYTIHHETVYIHRIIAAKLITS